MSEPTSAATPEKSDRAIAAEIGVSRKTVDRARQATGTHGPVEPAKRLGLDGKARTLPKRGLWIAGRWYPRWRIEELREKYRELPAGREGDEQ